MSGLRTRLAVLALGIMGGASAYAAEVTYTGPSGGDWALGSNWSGGSYPGSGDHALLDTTANLSSPVPNNILAIYVGTVGTGVLNLHPGADLTATKDSNWASLVGAGTGNHGTVNQSGGDALINYMEVGRGGTGVYSVTGGGLIIGREQSGNSLYLGTDLTTGVNNGDGTLEIRGGSFATRAGVHLGSSDGSGVGTFYVLGSIASLIGIGSTGSLDGSWTQNSNSVLRVGVDSLGVTMILIDDYQDDGGSFVTFQSGALLDVDYHNGATNAGTWTVMELEGADIVDHGLAFDAGVDTNVHIKVETAELPGYGSTSVNVLYISGDGVTVDGLTLSMVKDPANGLIDAYGDPREYAAKRSSQLVLVTGSDTTIKNCNLTTGGSYPYGYGDAFGKGRRPTDGDGNTDSAWISHSKQSGFLITGGASNVVVDNVTLNVRSYGHGFFMQQGAQDILFKDCQVLGDTMADSDDIIAHPEYQAWGFATYKEPIPGDIRISKHEGAFRTYGNSDYASNGYNRWIENVTTTNCLVERMRNGVAMGAHAGDLRVYDTELRECEMGFGSSAYGSTLFQRCKGDAVNGPLIYFQYSVDYPATYEVELTGATPGQGVWPIALISGADNRITLTSSAAPGVYSKEAYANTSQKWREWRHRPSGDIDTLSTGNYANYTTGNRITNLTDQILVFGPNATDNTGCVSAGGVLTKGTDNEYVGETLVPAPIVVQDTWSYPPNPTNVPWAQYSGGELILPTPPYTVFDGTMYVDDAESLGGSPAGDGGTTVSNGTLEVAPGFALQGEDLLLYGTGTAGQGAIYSDGRADNMTRLSSSSGVIALSGDTSIGVGISGNELLIGPIGGTGNLTKTGPGTLTMENGGNAFSGLLEIADGWVKARSNKVRNDVIIAAGAGLSQNGNLALNQGASNTTSLDGTLNVNGRGTGDLNELSVNIGSLTGGASGRMTSTSTAADQTVNVNSASADSSYSGTIDGRIVLVKNGAGTTLALNGTCTHT